MNPILHVTTTGVVRWREVTFFEFVQYIAANSGANWTEPDQNSLGKVPPRFCDDQSVILESDNDEFVSVESNAGCSEVFEPRFWIGEILS